MAPPLYDQDDDHTHSVTEFLRFYRYTSVYIAVVVTLILVVSIFSEVFGG